MRGTARSGVTMIGEIGLGTVNTGPEAKKHVAWCRKHGIQTIIHTGGPSIPGSNLISHEVVLEADPDVISHINGGHTALASGHICQLCEQAKGAIEIVHNGNEKAAITAFKTAMELKRTHEIIIGTDAPAGLGCAAARHPAHGDVPGELRRRCAGDRVLHGDGQHRTRAQARCRRDRARQAGRLRVHGSRAAYVRQDAAGVDVARRPTRHRHGDDRRQRLLRPLAQYATGGSRP